MNKATLVIFFFLLKARITYNVTSAKMSQDRKSTMRVQMKWNVQNKQIECNYYNILYEKLDIYIRLYKLLSLLITDAYQSVVHSKHMNLDVKSLNGSVTIFQIFPYTWHVLFSEGYYYKM